MPIDPTWFKYVPEFALAAPRFLRRLIQNEYTEWVAEELWGVELPPLPRELSTFSDDIAASARQAYNYLNDLAISRRPSDYWPNSPERFIINIYSRNSLPFHATTRGMPLQSSYEDMDEQLVRQYFGSPEHAIQSINALQSQLRALPMLEPLEYNVAWWTQGYSGMMVFRGALTLPNPNSGPTQAIYNYGSLAGPNVINVGDVVINTDFMSTSAHPSVAAEFVIRQALPYPGSNTAPQIIVDALYRRVLFRIDMRTGRNICPWTNLQQAEILFPLRSLFQVVSVEVGTYGLLVHLRELTQTEINNLTRTPKNIMTGHDVKYP